MMNCQTFKKLVNKLQEEGGDVLTPDELSRWESHLVECMDCLDYYQQVNAQDLLTSEEGEALVDSVLLATSESQQALDSVFTEMQSLETPPGFVDAVLAKSLPLQKRKQKWFRFQQAFQSLLLRPRFAQEISLAASMGWVLAFGLPNETLISTAEFQQWVVQVTESIKLGG